MTDKERQEKLSLELKKLRLQRQKTRHELDLIKLQKLNGTYKEPNKTSVKNIIITYMLISFLFVPILLLGLMFIIGQ